MIKLVAGFVLSALLLLMMSCSKLQDDLPPAGGNLNLHGPGWTDPTTNNFHGKSLGLSSQQLQNCLTCHGSDLKGGTSKVSCIACHQSEQVSLHGMGWTDTASTNFHGTAIRSINWDMSLCKSCHGVSYEGGKTSISCKTCHTQPSGPEYCTTCHGGPENAAPPRDVSKNITRTFRGVGAHQVHFRGTGIYSSLQIPCSECHTVPPEMYSVGHVDSPLPAEVPINGFMARIATNETTTVDWDSNLPVVSPSPAYSSANLTCGNTYCHGHFKNGNDTLVVVWTDTTAAATACGTCHGNVNKSTLAERALPKTSAEGGTHPTSTACSACHVAVVDNNLRIIDRSKHINGKLNVFGQERDF